jgi:hypothetical protein
MKNRIIVYNATVRNHYIYYPICKTLKKLNTRISLRFYFEILSNIYPQNNNNDMSNKNNHKNSIHFNVE